MTDSRDLDSPYAVSLRLAFRSWELKRDPPLERKDAMSSNRALREAGPALSVFGL